MKQSRWDKQVEKVVPATVYMISSSSDHQQSEEATNSSKFELPNPAGKAGGACTSAFLQQQYENGLEQTWMETLQSMKAVLSTMGFNQTPMLSSSRMFDIDSPMSIVPPGSGRRRALLIGINYVGQEGELTACHNDCLNIKAYLEEAHGFNESEMIILIDDEEGRYRQPTKDNIESAMCMLCKYSQPNDVVFVSFSGHGGNVADTGGDEDDGFDETLIPVDFQTNGHIVDDDILKMLVKPMPEGVTVTVLMDCCHSGTVLDLPYKISANDSNFTREEDFDMEIVTEPTRSDRGAMDYGPRKHKTKKDPNKKKNKEEDENKKDLAPDAPVGPKLAPNGMPVLPIRKAMNVSDIQDEHDDPLGDENDPCFDGDGHDLKEIAQQAPEQAKPKKKGFIGKLFGKKK